MKFGTMACPHVPGDNPRALASGLSYVHVGLQVDKRGITILYHLYQCRPCISYNFRANVGLGGINSVIGAFRCLKFHIYI